jgi:hypothetical protein
MRVAKQGENKAVMPAGPGSIMVSRARMTLSEVQVRVMTKLVCISPDDGADYEKAKFFTACDGSFPSNATNLFIFLNRDFKVFSHSNVNVAPGRRHSKKIMSFQLVFEQFSAINR